jgi:hypothetical protein
MMASAQAGSGQKRCGHVARCWYPPFATPPHTVATPLPGAARAPARKALHLHLDVEELAGGVAREHVELDVLAGELLGEDRRVQHFGGGGGRLNAVNSSQTFRILRIVIPNFTIQ